MAASTETIVQANIERIIEEKGLKKTGVAARAGFTLQQLSDMLGGRKIIKASMIPALSGALGVEPNDLFKEIA